MGSKKIWTTKDFKEGKVGIKFGGNFDLLSSIVSDCGFSAGYLVNNIKEVMRTGDMFIWVDGGYLTSYNVPSKHITHFVSESEIYLLGKKMKNESKYSHYNNTRGSLYLFAKNHDLNAWEFDILKRVVRCRKKGQFKQDLEKTIEVIRLYLEEYEEPERLSDIEGE